MSYIHFMRLVREAALAITDSGGLQEESTSGLLCLTLRSTAERPITVSEGSNRLITPETLGSAIAEVADGRWPRGRRPELWDGWTAGRVAKDIRRRSKAH